MPVESGADGSEIEMVFPENYYQLHEIFKIEESGQQCFVVAAPVRKADNMWSVIVRLVDDDYSTVLDVSACQVGMMTRWIGNIFANVKVVKLLETPVRQQMLIGTISSQDLLIWFND